MLDIKKVDHIGIRVHSKENSIKFYEEIGFELITDAGFDKGHPVIMQHRSGVVINLLGPSNASPGKNILMDVEDKYAGITHVSYRVGSIEKAKKFLASKNIELTGEFSFNSLHAIFFRDPDRNVIELDYYPDEEPLTRKTPSEEAVKGYQAHPE
ncbi:MAG: VOC family protein [bacterium]